jgi:nucleotide-binding universal stress UspA family protein
LFLSLAISHRHPAVNGTPSPSCSFYTVLGESAQEFAEVGSLKEKDFRNQFTTSLFRIRCRTLLLVANVHLCNWKIKGVSIVRIAPVFQEEVMPQLVEQKESKADLSKRVSLTKILVTTDFSEVSDRALDYAIALARRYDARIYLTHVITPDPFQFAEPQLAQATYEKVRQAAEEGITDILISGKLRGVPHEVLMEEGNVWPTLEKMIVEHEIDLVVAGTHGRGKVQKILIGSVAEEIFRRATTAVLTVGPAVKGGAKEIDLNHILFATDFGPGAERAAAHAFSLAQEHNAHLTLLHVIESAAAYTEESVARQREINIVRMKQLMPPGTENWCKPEFRVTFGSAVEEILIASRESKADLIVMGAKARKSLAGHVPLTIAYNVVTKATCPVLTVRG